MGGTNLDQRVSPHRRARVPPAHGIVRAGDRAVTEYVLRRLREEADAYGTRLLLLMDAPRSQVYADREVPSNASWLNAMAADVASSVGIDFVDLRDAFAADFAKHGERFDFQHDAHWNDRGHQVAAAVTAEWIASSLEPPAVGSRSTGVAPPAPPP